MISHPSSPSFQRNITEFILQTLICLILLRSCHPRNPFDDLDLKTQTLNPLATGFKITGSATSDSLGFRVSTAGDIDNDGYDDIIVAALGKDSVYVIYGGPKSSFLDLDLSITTLDPQTTGFMITGNAAGDGFGQSVSTAGDIDNDGYDDIIIGASKKNTNQGVAYVFYGGPKSSRSNIDLSTQTLNPTSTGFKMTGSAASDRFGYSVSIAGDIDKDGYDDIIVGAYGMNGGQGKVYVIYGGPKSSMSDWDFSSSATLTPSSTGFYITGYAANNYCGVSVSTAGDINKDGFGDIIVGAYGRNSERGAVYVIYGGPKISMTNIHLNTQTLYPLTTGFMITGNAVGDQFGFTASTAGDVNNDGYDDIIIGAYYKNTGQGAAYVIYCGENSAMSNIDLDTQTLSPSTTGFTMTGSAVGDYFGISVSTAGDLNKDGYHDIIVGASAKNTAYVIYGGPKSSMSDWDFSSDATLDPTSTGFTITGNAAGDYLGLSATTAGDFNNDGYDEIVIGASRKNTNQGAAYVIYASCSKNCKQCSSESVCTQCKNSYLMYQYECFNPCPAATFRSNNICKDCPTGCFTCSSLTSCSSCAQGYTLSESLCVKSGTQEEAAHVISSATQGIGSVICVGSAVVPFSAMVSKIVQSTRYLNLSVTNELADVYQTWQTDLISWDVPNVFSNEDNFKSSPALFAKYDLGSPFLVNFWPTLINVGIGFGTFFACILLRKFFEHKNYKGWAYSLLRKLVAGSFNFALIQAYACMDDILFYLVLDAKTNSFNSFFSWTSMICAVLFLALGCLQVFFNFWTVYKYQGIKNQGANSLEAFNEKNKYWELFYSDFNDVDLFCQSFFAIAIIRSALSSFIITVLYDYPLMQTAYLVIIDTALISFLYFKTPFKTLRGKLAQYYYEIITLLVHFCALILAFQDTFNHSSDTIRLIMSTGILYLNTALISGAIGFMFIEIYETIRSKQKQPQIVPEDSQETQNLTQTVSPLQVFAPKREYWINRGQIDSIENFHLEPEKHQNRNGLNTELNLNTESSRELEISSNKSHQATRPMIIQNRLQSLRKRRKISSSIFPVNSMNRIQLFVNLV